jgi:endogenous inhibitor of DNA gyrase (YacG/DUF329 family)
MGTLLLCVLCRLRPADERWRPFCSERCRNEDLARWATGYYRVAGSTLPTGADAETTADENVNHS